MTTSTTARPYAAAAFEAAKTANELSLWSNALKQLSLAVADIAFQSAAKNPLCTKKQLADILIGCFHTVCGDGSQNGQQEIENFIRLLANNKRLVLLPGIATLFEEAVAKESGYLSLVVTSAYEMDADQKKHTQTQLTEKLKSKLNIVFNVDKNIIGGLLVRSGNWVLDDTVKGKLRRLKSALSSRGEARGIQ